MTLYDLFDSWYTKSLNCSIEDLDNFAENANEEQIIKLNELMFAQKYKEAKILLASLAHSGRASSLQGEG